MIIGIDFDNTLACYDGLFYAEACKRGLLPPDVQETIAQDKNSVRDALRAIGKEEDFTLLQGYIYGPGILEAKVYDGAIECLKALHEQKVTFYIVSHKTPYPYLGEKYDLHAHARNWLKINGFFEDELIDPQHVFFETSKEDKLLRIKTQKCTHFIDDLPDILEHALFPTTVEPLFFSPEENTVSKLTPFISWQDLNKYLLPIA